MEIRPIRVGGGYGVELVADAGAGPERVAVVEQPVLLETLTGAAADAAPQTVRAGYDEVANEDGVLVGLAWVNAGSVRCELEDRWWAQGDRATRVDRRLRVTGTANADAAVRLALEAEVSLGGDPDFDRFTFFAPPALYDLNDVDGDGMEDYLDTRELVYRDDRLTGLAVLAYLPERFAGLALTREDIPEFDDVPDRVRGQRHVRQRTDIGSLGLAPGTRDEARLIAAYPFVERSRSHALTAREREPWGAFWPAAPGETLKASYSLRLVPGESDIEALWELWRDRITRLAPRRVELTESLETITRLRVEALLPYYAELPENVAGRTPVPAGFVTNCHPQDGKQLENVIQYGFTGQNVLNALHVLGHVDDADARKKALRVIDFFATQAAENEHGLVRTLFDLDTGRPASWWSGLLLPLAYADAGADLHALMGPVYDHMRYAIEALDGVDGTYLRCMCEEHAALLRVYEAELNAGRRHGAWLEAARRFGEFLLAEQEPDGSWRRAYDFAGQPIIEPRQWFGPTELNQKSSTATAVPVLVSLYRLTGEQRWLDAATRAGGFVAAHFVRDLKFNGGIHDSIYARPQLVDSESILFAMRASLLLAQATGEADAARAAADAAKVLATWVYLWDVPLPPQSTLAQHDFRSTGWSACDTCGAGYIHPYELHAVPDLFQVALDNGDEALALIADLILHGSNETVATKDHDWGYARLGLQEEGLLVSWWLIDDPMFAGTSFGGRGKGEGNKTCLPWISAVAIDAYDEVMKRFGTTNLRSYLEQSPKPAP